MYNSIFHYQFVLGVFVLSMDRKVFLFSNDRASVSDIRKVLEHSGYDTVVKHKLAQGIKAIKGPELIILDLPEGVNALKEIKSYHPDATVIMLTENNCINAADSEGAYDCLQKPMDPDRMKMVVKNASRYLFMKEELERFKSIEAPSFISDKNLKMHRVVKQINRVSKKNVPVLVSGEKGSGKQTVARMIHHYSPRSTGPFVQINSIEGIEDELFGRGANRGNIVQAEGGTLFIENISSLGSGIKSRIAAFIKKKSVSNGSGGDAVSVDARVVCSVNGVDKDDPLLKNFAVQINVPSLRERTEDIIPLAEHFLNDAISTFKIKSRSLSKEAKKALLKYRWPGNVGELQNMIRKACLISTGEKIDCYHLGLSGSSGVSIKEFLGSKLNRYIQRMTHLGDSGIHGAVISEVEKALIELVLSETGGNQVKAANTLGITRTTLRSKIKLYKIGLK